MFGQIAHTIVIFHKARNADEQSLSTISLASNKFIILFTEKYYLRTSRPGILTLLHSLRIDRGH